MERAKQAEYQAIATSLLSIVGGSIGQHRDPANPVLIGVGLGQFKSIGRLTSLHSSFLDYFIPLARSLRYIVIGINEYYTSKKCPNCENFVAQVTLRQLYCPNCQRYHHRDVMAAENMSRIMRGYLEKQKRPRYLQPRTEDGRYPWEEDASMAATSSSSSSSTVDSGSTSRNAPMTTTSSNAPTRSRKRTSSVSNQATGRPEKIVLV
ncbi:hypothetical protein BGZ92_003447 [Podila epicladia]|nr:hypothetical protein BGZ92_003447 [Podila epicladia]